MHFLVIFSLLYVGVLGCVGVEVPSLGWYLFSLCQSDIQRRPPLYIFSEQQIVICFRFNLACLLSAPHLLTPQSRLTSVSKVFRKRNVEDTDQWDDNAAEAPINTEPRQAGVMGDKLANVISSRFVLFIFLSVVIYAVASSFVGTYIRL